MNFLEPLAPIVHWGLRLSLGATFIYHGIGKFPDPSTFAPMVFGSVALAWAVAIGEVVAGVFVIIGAFTKEVLTRLGGLMVVVTMIFAIYLVHWKNGWNVMNGGMEFQVMMLALGLYFAARGNKV